MQPVLGRAVIYTAKIDEMAAFYARHFNYRIRRAEGDRIVELVPPAGGLILLLHPAAKGQKQGQVLIKLVFDVEDVAAFCASAGAQGLRFGKIHSADRYAFANAKDPSAMPFRSRAGRLRVEKAEERSRRDIAVREPSRGAAFHLRAGRVDMLPSEPPTRRHITEGSFPGRPRAARGAVV